MRKNFLMHGLRGGLPSPDPIVTFEVAARHLSFTHADAEGKSGGSARLVVVKSGGGAVRFLRALFGTPEQDAPDKPDRPLFVPSHMAPFAA